jgi:cytochrome c5
MEGETAMMKTRLLLSAALLTSICAVTMWAQDSTAPSAKAAKRHADARQSGKEDDPGEGERIFVRRCSSCHSAPEGFSPRISGTVVRHMRVRASLSAHEEEALLRFFNP